jgi:NAD(P)-dependent dehydrogenase (short-subunit alcohol dehydrogenase family)
MQTAIVTGGNGGLGYKCARVIAAASPQWHVIIASRDRAKSAEAVRSIMAETRNSGVAAMELNLGSLDSVRRLGVDFAARALPPIGAIVCNAAIQIISGITYNEDGYETTFAVNHLGHFLLVNLLLRHLNDRARIVVVSSGTHNPDQFTGMPKPDYRDAISAARPELGADRVKAGRRAYTTSKLCNVMFTYELSRRLKAEGHDRICVNAFDPGLMPGTGLARDYRPFQKFLWNFALPALRFIPGVNSTSKSGVDLARLVLDPGLEGVSSKYFVGPRSVPSSKESYDARKAAELWDSSVTLVRLKPEETILRIVT